jgi:hypothetical protein
VLRLYVLSILSESRPMSDVVDMMSMIGITAL